MQSISFELTMPNRGSWNGKWSGEDRRFIILKSLTDKKTKELLGQKNSKYFSHNWSDGWCASIEARKITASNKKELRKHVKNGFQGYDWMVSNILRYGDTIKPSNEIKAA